MKKSKKYQRVVFDAPAIEKIISEFQSIVKKPGETSFENLHIQKDEEEWAYDTFEEFISEFRKEFSYSYLLVHNPNSPHLTLTIIIWKSIENSTEVKISSYSRDLILRLGNIVDTCATDCYSPPPPQPKKIPPKPKIFIGHGGSKQWRDLKDHLHDQHGYDIVSYETGSRAGHTIRDVIAEMLEKSAFAILIMTGEDHLKDGTIRARQNVVHELGLFQGRLGFTKAIVLKEEDTEEFSNIYGVHQIRYSKGNIKETFGIVLAVLNKEFGERK